MSLQMTKAEREAFLADLHVGVLSIPEPGRGPLTVPIWYAYEPGGELRVVTGRDSRKGRLLAAAPRVSLCAQTETAPYRYVSVEGPVVYVGPVDRARDVRALAHRYLGPELGDQYVAATAAGAGDEMLVRIRPERWLTVDYRKEYGG
jgi:PPOX class probable F420-dependent enzyme